MIKTNNQFIDKVFICYSQNIIKRGWFKLHKEYYRETFIHPQCSSCNKKLKVGDYIDGHYPYDIEFNRCKGCK